MLGEIYGLTRGRLALVELAASRRLNGHMPKYAQARTAALYTGLIYEALDYGHLRVVANIAPRWVENVAEATGSDHR